MKLHEHLFFLRHIAMGREGMEKVVHYLDNHLPAMFSHPLKTMEDCNMLSFLHRVLQVYVVPCTAASVAMVICTCSPRLIEPLHRGSP